jgi:hypothetical protein
MTDLRVAGGRNAGGRNAELSNSCLVLLKYYYLRR